MLGEKHAGDGAIEDGEVEVLGTLGTESEEQKMEDGKGREESERGRGDRRVHPHDPDAEPGQGLHFADGHLEAAEVATKDMSGGVRVAHRENVIPTGLNGECSHILRQSGLFQVRVRGDCAKRGDQLAVEVDLRSSRLPHEDAGGVAELGCRANLAAEPTDTGPTTRDLIDVLQRGENQRPVGVVEVRIRPDWIISGVVFPILDQGRGSFQLLFVEDDGVLPPLRNLCRHG